MSVSRTRIIPAGEQTLIAQLNHHGAARFPIDKAHIALIVAPGDAAGPAPVGYGGAVSGELEGR